MSRGSVQARGCAVPPGGTRSREATTGGGSRPPPQGETSRGKATTAASGKSVLTADSALFADPHIVPHHRSVLCPNRLDADECEGEIGRASCRERGEISVVAVS